MMRRKRFLALAMSVVLAAGVFTNVSAQQSGDSTGDRLIYDGVKYKISRQAGKNDVFSDTRKGLLLQSYGSGSTATFKETFSGNFEIEMKALAEETRPSLSEYRLHFTSATTGETFAVGVKDIGNETSAYVVVEEELAGISYALDYDDKAHGFSTSQNGAGIYTRVAGAHTTSLVFDPATMEVKIKNYGTGDAYKTIWCLAESVVDGRRFNHVLKPFDYYSVSVEFTQVGTGKSGELLIYNVNGEDYGESSLPAVYATVNSNITLQPVVGKKYTLPKASVYGMEETPEISCTVKDANGKKLVSGKVGDGISFTPKSSGSYYLYYSVAGQEKAGTYVTLKAYPASTVTCKIASCDPLTESVGVHTTMTIPARKAVTNLLMTGKAFYTDVTIAKGKAEKETKQAVDKAFDYTFEEAGIYTVTWSAKINGKTYQDSMKVLVDEKIPGVVGADIKKVYDKGSKFTIPEATVYLNGQEVKAVGTATLPSGKKEEGNVFALDEIGIYHLTYTYEVNGKKGSFEKIFQVPYGSENIFLAGEDTTVTYDDTAGNADFPGVQIEMTSKNAVATYAKTLDLSDNTKLDNLIELYVIPQTAGTRDMTGFYITLTDKLNPSNQVSIRVIAGDGNMSSGSYVRVKATGQDGYLGLYKQPSWDTEPYTWVEGIENMMAHNKGGYTTDLDFAFESTAFDMKVKTLALRYDASEKALYGQQRIKLVHDKDYREELITDLDDPALYKNLWQGFTDNSQVELSISPVSVSGKATFKILSVDGESLQQKILADTTAPEVTIDMKGMKQAPDAKVGTAYPIFDVKATDDLCAEDTLIKQITVKHNGKTVEVKDQAFVPTEEGVYQIQYTVSDGFGNTTRKNVNVTAKNKVPAMKMKVDGALEKSMTYGKAYKVPTFKGEGGTGKHASRSYYIYDGKETEFDGSFVPMAEGSYTVVCEVSDYIGQTAKVSETIDLVFAPAIIFEDSEIVLPEAIAAENTFGFENYQAIYYTKVGADAKKTACRITVTDAAGTRELEKDNLYIPKMSKKVKKANILFTFSAEVDGKTIDKTVKREVKLVSISKDNQFMTGYFMKDNATLKAFNRYTVLSATKNGNAKVAYIRPVQVQEFSLVMKAEQNKNGSFQSNFDTIRVTLTDKKVKSQKVQFTIYKKGKSLQISINGGRKVGMPGSLTAESMQNLEIGYQNDDYSLVGAENTSLGTVETYLNGTAFKGFASGEVYVDIELLGAKAGAAIDIISMNNQTFLGAIQDTIDPQLFVNGSYSGIYTEGTKLTLPTANAYDVLNYVTIPVLSVTDANGKTVKALNGTELNGAIANQEYEIQLNKLGRYTVSYTAEDAAGRRIVASKTIEIVDDVLPTLELKGNYPKTVSAGKSVKVEKYKIQDNGNTDKVEVLVYCGTPKGIVSEVKGDKIETKEKGRYTVYYFLTDENGNKNVESFTFEAN